MSIIIASIYIFVLAVILAFIEIQIEGPHGWAEKMYTWKPKENGLINKIKNKLKYKKPLTGYHIGLVLFLITIIHLPYAWGASWSWRTELVTLSLLAFWTFIEDFLWFVMNPHFGIKKFKSEHIWWHDKWAIGIPIDYYIALFFSLVLYLPVKANIMSSFYEWLTILALFIGLTILTIIITELAKAITKNFKK